MHAGVLPAQAVDGDHGGEKILGRGDADGEKIDARRARLQGPVDQPRQHRLLSGVAGQPGAVRIIEAFDPDAEIDAEGKFLLGRVEVPQVPGQGRHRAHVGVGGGIGFGFAQGREGTPGGFRAALEVDAGGPPLGPLAQALRHRKGRQERPLGGAAAKGPPPGEIGAETGQLVAAGRGDAIPPEAGIEDHGGETAGWRQGHHLHQGSPPLSGSTEFRGTSLAQIPYPRTPATEVGVRTQRR